MLFIYLFSCVCPQIIAILHRNKACVNCSKSYVVTLLKEHPGSLIQNRLSSLYGLGNIACFLSPL